MTFMCREQRIGFSTEFKYQEMEWTITILFNQELFLHLQTEKHLENLDIPRKILPHMEMRLSS